MSEQPSICGGIWVSGSLYAHHCPGCYQRAGAVEGICDIGRVADLERQLREAHRILGELDAELGTGCNAALPEAVRGMMRQLREAERQNAAMREALEDLENNVNLGREDEAIIRRVLAAQPQPEERPTYQECLNAAHAVGGHAYDGMSDDQAREAMGRDAQPCPECERKGGEQ